MTLDETINKLTTMKLHTLAKGPRMRKSIDLTAGQCRFGIDRIVAA